MAEHGSRDEQWADVVSQWRASGLSQKEFCRRRDISDRFIPEPHSRCLTITFARHLRHAAPDRVVRRQQGRVIHPARSCLRFLNNHTPSLDFRRLRSYKFYDLDGVCRLSGFLGCSLTSKQCILCGAVGFTRQVREFAKRSGRKPSRRTPASEPRITTFEKRGAMPDRKSLVFTLWLTSSLALLASVLVVPIRTSGSASVSSQPDCLRRNLVQLLGHPTIQISAAMATDAVLEVDVLPPESEEQDRADALDEPRVSFLIPCSFRKVPDRQVIAPRSILAFYPLRC